MSRAAFTPIRQRPTTRGLTHGCDLCEESFEAGGGEWNEQNEGAADIKALCSHCYENARDRNEDVPHLARGAAARLTASEIDALLHHAVHETQALQELSDKAWGWRDLGRWDFDDEVSTLTFSDTTGGGVIADVRLVGSYSSRSNTFQWAWETFRETARESAPITHLRTFGEVRGIPDLTTPLWKCDESTGREMTSLAAYVLGADAVYRAAFDHQYWFMLLSNFRRAH